MKQKYTVILEPEEDGGYHVFCPVLPGCHSEGETVEEALDNVREAIEVHQESLLAHDQPVPTEAGLVIASVEVETDARLAVHPIEHPRCS
ncbi:MAG: type II toxin-antitoxin system HicB family antitoxin [bacterium]|nr:type II toxin-antitoxin system HicB family antitoxin [bacterium]